MANEVIILGDSHIGKGATIGRLAIGAALNSRIVDQVNLLDWTLEQAVLRGVRTIIITGDVFEEPKPPPSLITLFVSWLKRCNANGVYVHIIVGNHDILRTGNFYTSPLDIIAECQLDNVSIYKDISTIFMGDTAFTFLPFRDRKSFSVESNAEALELLANNLSYEVASIPSIYQKILVGHLAIEGSIPVGDEIDDLINELFCPIELLKSYDYVWMGHVHKPQVLNNNPHIAHIGSMDISNYGETDHQKYLICYDLEEKSFQQIVLPTRPPT
jgi:DNA repair protein SbcD/Mre11